MDMHLSPFEDLMNNWTNNNLMWDKKLSDDNDDSYESSSLDDEEETQLRKVTKIMRTLPHYEPDQQMLKALSVNFTNESLSQKNKTFAEYLQTQCLDYDNVCSVLSTLLGIEDVSTMQLFAQLMQPDVTLQRISKLHYSYDLVGEREFNPEDVLSPYLDEVVLIPMSSLLVAPLPKDPILALLPHKHEKLYLKHSMRRQIAPILQVTRQSIQLLFNPNDYPGDKVLKQTFFVILRSRRIPIRFMYRAMQLLQESPQLRRYLFPIKSPPAVPPAAIKLPNLALLNANIAYNAEQLQAVKHIVNGPNTLAPYIVFGPPGTGKTTTIVEAILQLRLLQPRSRILVTAGSNSACDTIAMKICEYFAGNQSLQIQLADRAMESRLVTLDVEPNNQIIRVFSRSIFAKGLQSVHPLLLRHSNCAKRIYEHLGVNILRRFGIIVATLCTVGRLVTANVGKFNYFTHIFIDEAGASMEPETLIGIMGIKQNDICQVILSGDHKQLSAVITNNRAASLGLRHSLMERLLRSDLYAVDSNGNYDHTLQTRLRRNYRSHPKIVELFNNLFYNGELIAQAPPGEVNLAANWNLLPNPKFPIIFQATHGVTKREYQSPSYYNSLEAQVLMWYVRQLLINGIGGGVRVKQQDIGIIAPYSGQCRVISDMLRREGYFNVEVGSVEKYQGREKSIIIATLVRSFSSMGFLRNPRRINVLLSRAKSLIILIGNPVTLRYHRGLNFIINECKLQGNYVFKKKDGARRPYFLNDCDDDDDVDFVIEEIVEEKLEPWYAEMPADIGVSLPEGQLLYNSNEGSSSDEADSLAYYRSPLPFSTCSSSITQLDLDMENLSLNSAELAMPIVNHCGSVPLFTTEKLLQLQKLCEMILADLKSRPFLMMSQESDLPPFFKTL